MSSRPAVVLLSGGLDSPRCWLWRGAEGSTVMPCRSITGSGTGMSWKQPIAWLMLWVHASTDLPARSASLWRFPLTSEIAVPKDRDESQMSTGIPITYVPARNTIFLSVALGWAEVLGRMTFPGSQRG